MTIDILCKVVDNFGDIGVVYRLARALSELPERPRLRLVVDDLRAFSLLDPAIHAAAGKQLAHGWEIFPWDGGAGESRAAFQVRPSRALLECFACGRPDWLEDILFNPSSDEGCLIVDIEYLTAEAYAEDFHRMPSLTRSPLVRKAMFLPGFSAGTGGLTLDKAFALSLERASSEEGRADLRSELLAKAVGAGAGAAAEEAFWVCVFGYERDYGRIVADLASYRAGGAAGRARPLLALAAAGKSQDCFLRAWEAAGKPFPVLALPFLAQEDWDAVLAACDFAIVRGEDSWSRAALAGSPFLWQAYPQEGRHQLVKVAAFLDRLRPHFAGVAEAAAFSALEALYLAFNDRERDGSAERGGEGLLPVLEAYPDIQAGFRAFSGSLGGNGNLAANLVTFLREIV